MADVCYRKIDVEWMYFFLSRMNKEAKERKQELLGFVLGCSAASIYTNSHFPLTAITLLLLLLPTTFQKAHWSYPKKKVLFFPTATGMSSLALALNECAPSPAAQASKESQENYSMFRIQRQIFSQSATINIFIQ